MIVCYNVCTHAFTICFFIQLQPMLSFHALSTSNGVLPMMTLTSTWHAQCQAVVTWWFSGAKTGCQLTQVILQSPVSEWQAESTCMDRQKPRTVHWYGRWQREWGISPVTTSHTLTASTPVLCQHRQLAQQLVTCPRPSLSMCNVSLYCECILGTIKLYMLLVE